jgi:hypothetical protein
VVFVNTFFVVTKVRKQTQHVAALEKAEVIQNPPPLARKLGPWRPSVVAQIDPRSKKVVCVHASQMAAALTFGSRNQSNISSCCTGSRKYAAGFEWRYATNEEAANATKEAENVRVTSAEIHGKFSTEENEVLMHAKRSNPELSLFAIAALMKRTESSVKNQWYKNLRNRDSRETNANQRIEPGPLERGGKGHRALHPASQAVVQIDPLSNKVLCVHASQSVAATAVGGHVNCIARCCKGPMTSTSAGFMWRYATNDEAAEAIKKQKSRRKPVGLNQKRGLKPKKRVVQIDPISGAAVGFHESMKAAATAVGGGQSSGISRCCDGKLPSAYGFYWRLATGGEIKNMFSSEKMIR